MLYILILARWKLFFNYLKEGPEVIIKLTQITNVTKKISIGVSSLFVLPVAAWCFKNPSQEMPNVYLFIKTSTSREVP